MAVTAAPSISRRRPPVAVAGPGPVGAVLRTASRIRVTIVYLATLWLVDMVLDAVSGATRSVVVLRTSTNLANLAHGRMSTLVTSAFVHESPFIAREWVVLGVLLAAAEWSWGSRRLIAVFLAGHVGATLIVAAGLTASISMRWLPQSLAHSSDVGMSYGLMAVGGGLTGRLPRLLRPVWAACWLADVTVALVSGQTFTEAGHLIAFSIGLVVAASWVRRMAAERPTPAAASSPILANAVAALAFTQNAIVIPPCRRIRSGLGQHHLDRLGHQGEARTGRSAIHSGPTARTQVGPSRGVHHREVSADPEGEPCR